MKRFKKILSALIAAAVTASSLLIPGVYAEQAPDAVINDDAVIADDAAPEAGEESPGSMITLPSDMRAAVITPSVDFFADDGEDPEAVGKELAEIYSEFGRIGLNTVIINTVFDGNAFFTLSPAGGKCDPVYEAVESAYENGLSPYVVFDIGYVLSECRSGADAIDTLISKAHRFALRYRCSGILLDDYYILRNVTSFGDYMSNGSGIGYTNWLYDTSEQYFSTAADIIRRTDNSMAVGIMINDAWANAASNPEGSQTEDTTEAFYDGHADTKGFIEKGYADLAVVRAMGSLTSSRLPFEKVTGWWGELTEKAGIPLYVMHQNDFIGTDAVGWNGEDQLLKQITKAKEIPSYSGSAFISYEALKKDPLGSTDTLRAYFDKQINEASLFEDLKMTSPSALTYTTTEASVAFMGTFDSNFPVYLNGSEIKLNAAGNFYIEKKLESGLNTFTIKHKSKTYTYSITRKITVLKAIGSAIGEGKSLTVDGGTKITHTARASKGANVYGVVNGTTVPMSEASDTADEDESNSSYVRYTGQYIAPAGLIGQAQNLGNIRICASFAGYSMEAVGASVTVNAEPEPVKQTEVIMNPEASAVGSGEVLATMDAPHSSGETVKYVRTLYNNTIVYDGKTADDIPTPVFSQLPANTLEIYRSTSGNYYVTESGKRFSASSSVLEDGPAITDNPLFVKSTGTSNGNSYIKIKLGHRTGFNMF